MPERLQRPHGRPLLLSNASLDTFTDDIPLSEVHRRYVRTFDEFMVATSDELPRVDDRLRALLDLMFLDVPDVEVWDG